ncbi:lysylphosphatidylglycerol synthase transmembrane domain-containing protein [Salipiger aestuarii]|uniref:lysylphosphatidylglycerol synthase transmembrane domain-containing protein n=1 Tax=Salipiger aestuarii TaxID=568098 RepID=UPI0012386A8A|nr:lysylphosphatidylglycerol synthase transmembrane domain-containing protein [Salipiger aestuarii]KAA8616051.1 hypothetical protein AL037_02150 [Salipiger aestuarii]
MTVLRMLVPLALIALCLWLADAGGVILRLAGASPGWIGTTVVLLGGVTGLSALRWRLTAGALGLPMTRRAALGEYFMAQFVNQTLPGGVLGDAARAQRSRQGGALAPAAQAVVIERASGQVGMGAVLALGLGLSDVPLPRFAWTALAVLAALAVALALIGARRSGSWPAAIRATLLRQSGPQAGLSLVIAALTVAGFAAAARATGTTLTLPETALLGPLILTAMLLPASVGGWGWREGAASALFPLAGLAPEAGLAASIAFGLGTLAAALPGAFFLRRPQGARTIADPPK